MIHGLNAKPKTSIDEKADNDDKIRDDCIAQLNHYIKDMLAGPFPLQDDDELLSDLSEWWKNNVVNHELIAYLCFFILSFLQLLLPHKEYGGVHPEF